MSDNLVMTTSYERTKSGMIKNFNSLAQERLCDSRIWAGGNVMIDTTNLLTAIKVVPETVLYAGVYLDPRNPEHLEPEKVAVLVAERLVKRPGVAPERCREWAERLRTAAGSSGPAGRGTSHPS